MKGYVLTILNSLPRRIDYALATRPNIRHRARMPGGNYIDANEITQNCNEKNVSDVRCGECVSEREDINV